MWLILTPNSCHREEKTIELTYSAQPRPGLVERYDWTFAVHPLHNPDHILNTYQPLLDRIQLPRPQDRLIAQPSRDYAAFEEKILRQEADFILPNPLQSLMAMEAGYHVVAMAGRPEDFRGLVIARRDRMLHDFKQLIGKTIAYPAPTALAACILPQWMFHQNGLDLEKDLVHDYVGSQHSAIFHAYLGEAEAGVTWPPPWRNFQLKYPREASELEVVWETPPLVNNSVMVHARVPADVKDRVVRQLLHLADSPEGRVLLALIDTEAFLPADNATYEPVRAFIARFEAEVRPVIPPTAKP